MPILGLLSMMPLHGSLAATSKSADLFQCVLALHNAGSWQDEQRVSFSALPEGEKPTVLFLPIGWLPQKNGRSLEEFVLLTQTSMSCHRLHSPTIDRGAGSVYRTYAFSLDHASFRLPPPQIKFSYITQSDGDDGSLIASRLEKSFDNDSKGKTERLTPKGCLDPASLEYQRLSVRLVLAVNELTRDLTQEAQARKSIRRAIHEGPPPAFRPPADLLLVDSKNLNSCRRLGIVGLNRALELYESASRSFSASDEEGRTDPSDHGSSVR